jgi:DNA-binding GntR family transcriptional regulator
MTSEPSVVRRPTDALLTSSLRAQATRVLRARIITGQLVPGQLYAIGPLASELGVSVTPIREALLDLSNEGLVKISRNRGFSVQVLTDHDLDEIVELRRMLEVPAVRQITERRLISNQAELRQLAGVTEQCAASGDWVGFLDSDRAFHLALLSNLGNERLLHFVGSLRDQSRLYGLDRIAGTRGLIESTHEHKEILMAMSSGQADHAASLMDQHLNHTRGIWAGRNEDNG